MKGAARGLGIAVGGLGLIQICLGIAFWTGNAVLLIPIHMALGTVLVLCLSALAGLGAAARIPAVLVLAGFVWGALTVIYGMTQELVLAGTLHWLAQALHLAVGLVAILIAGLIARSVQSRHLEAATI